jgi:integrase/recombinase XerD
VASRAKTDLETEVLSWVERFTNGIAHLEQRTRLGYRQAVLSFVSFLAESSGDEPFSQTITEETIAGWLRQLAATYRISTVLPQAGIVARFVSFLHSSGVLAQDPLGELKRQFPKQGLQGIILALMSPSPRECLEALRAAPRFASPLAPEMQRFIALGRSQAKAYRVEEEALCGLDRFLASLHPPPPRLSETLMRQWLAALADVRPGTRYLSFAIVRRFCLYLRRFDPSAYVPEPSLTPPRGSPFVPHIYSRSDIIALLEAARRLKPSTLSPLRPQVYHLLISLLYTTGMRLSEALNLELADVDRQAQLLRIRRTKFSKSRLIPLSASMMGQLEDYLELRANSGAPNEANSPLLQNPHRKGPYSKSAVRTTFHLLLERAAITWPQDRCRPRIHDVRHTMAVHRLEDWYRQGVDVQSQLRLLSTYLGHVNLASTQPYLSLTTELLQQAAGRFRSFVVSKFNAEGE